MKEQTFNREETKAVGGSIPIELYWQYKSVQANRKESAAEALENAIRLYIDLDTGEEK